MHIQNDASLANYSTMKLGGIAKHVVGVFSSNDLLEALNWAKDQSIDSIIMIGDGSNIVWRDEGFDGLLIVNKISGFKIIPEPDNKGCVVQIGAGENWDSVVERTVNDGWSGVEALSLIPGTAGATPVQNVGAYGQEIAQTLINLEAYDRSSDKFVIIENQGCNFSYRSSRFKTTDTNRFLITKINLKLSRTNITPPFYQALQYYLDEHQINDYSPASIRQAVINIRNSKLPDPKVIPNNGSFFANPIIDTARLAELKANNPNIVFWPQSDGRTKLSAAWLIDQAGFKEFHDSETGMATWPKQSLVLVNEKAHSTADLLKFCNKIKGAIKQKFDIELVFEPLLLP